jgi:hypothetical protein
MKIITIELRTRRINPRVIVGLTVAVYNLVSLDISDTSAPDMMGSFEKPS